MAVLSSRVLQSCVWSLSLICLSPTLSFMQPPALRPARDGLLNFVSADCGFVVLRTGVHPGTGKRSRPLKSHAGTYRQRVVEHSRAPAHFEGLRLVGIVVSDEHQRAIRVFESRVQHVIAGGRVNTRGSYRYKLGVVPHGVILDAVFHLSRGIGRVHGDQPRAGGAAAEMRALSFVGGHRPLNKSASPITEDAYHQLHIFTVLDRRVVLDGACPFSEESLGPEGVVIIGLHRWTSAVAVIGHAGHKRRGANGALLKQGRTS